MSKGQINLDFILSVVVFLSVMSFITLQIIGSISIMRRDLALEDIKSTAFQASNMILNGKGWPENWNFDPANVQRIGLSSGFYSLSMEKITSLNTICSSPGGYKKFVSLLKLEYSKDVYLNISTLNGKTLALCSSGVESQIRNKAQIVRTSFTQQNDIVKIDLRVIL